MVSAGATSKEASSAAALSSIPLRIVRRHDITSRISSFPSPRIRRHVFILVWRRVGGLRARSIFLSIFYLLFWLENGFQAIYIYTRIRLAQSLLNEARRARAAAATAPPAPASAAPEPVPRRMEVYFAGW